MSQKILKALLGLFTVALIGLVGAGWYMLQNDEGLWTIHPAPTPSVSPTPTKTGTDTVAMMRVPIPADSSCKDCHKANSIDVPEVPVMGHQLEGWGNCTSCHGKEKLVATAPGHKGIHQDSCLMCHQTRPETMTAALPRPHHAPKGKECTDCHKPGGEGPLPENMAERDNCWVCHMDSDNQDLFENNTSS